MLKEKLISSFTSEKNGITSARYTARNINGMFALSIVLWVIIIGGIGHAFNSPDDAYTQCIEEYDKQVKEVRDMNEDLVNRCVKEYRNNIYELKSCVANPIPVPVNSCTNKWTGSVAPISDEPQRKIENNLRKRFGLEDCRATNDFHRLGKYNLEWMAYDIACESGKSFKIKSPWRYKIEKVWYGVNLWDYVILSKFDNPETRIVLWHIVTYYQVGHTLKDGEIIWEVNVSWASTNYHIHIELWDWYMNVSREFALWEKYRKINGTALLNHRQWDFWQQRKNVYYFTSYDLWDESQNDSTPCIGASGKDLCEMERNWIRTMALTSDIREELGVKFGDKVRLLWEDGCEWVYEVHDEMNKRFRSTPWVLRPWTPYYIKGDLPSKWGGVCSVTKI